MKRYYVEGDQSCPIIKACDNCARDYYREGYFIQVVDASEEVSGKCELHRSCCSQQA